MALHRLAKRKLLKLICCYGISSSGWWLRVFLITSFSAGSFSSWPGLDPLGSSRGSLLSWNVLLEVPSEDTFMIFFLDGAIWLSPGHLKLTRGPAGNRTTTGSLVSRIQLGHEDTSEDTFMKQLVALHRISVCRCCTDRSLLLLNYCVEGCYWVIFVILGNFG